MKWRREIDYHGSREYGAEEPALRRFATRLMHLVKLARRMAGRLGGQPEPPIVLLRDGQHNFSQLGLGSPALTRGRAAECPFPLKSEPVDHRSYRVFP